MKGRVLRLSRAAVDATDISSLAPYVRWSPNARFFEGAAGKEHYRLLALLSQSEELVAKRLIDVGHYHGFSAVALSINPRRVVESFDVVDCVPAAETSSKTRENVRLHIRDVSREDTTRLSDDCELVVIDIGHTGHDEARILQRLRDEGFRGIVLLDDIRLNDAMRQLFRDIPEKTLDATPYGHWSGTGIVVFDPGYLDVELLP